MNAEEVNRIMEMLAQAIGEMKPIGLTVAQRQQWNGAREKARGTDTIVVVEYPDGVLVNRDDLINCGVLLEVLEF